MELPEHVEVLVVGAGFGGLGAAIRLTQAGYQDVLVIERGTEVGGTWRDNTYPGAACDVPSHLYSFSFARNPDWSRSFSQQPEIQAYLGRVARESGALDRIRFGTEMTGAYWDAEAGRWVVDTNRGRITADVFVPAVGSLAEPALPDIKGIDEFGGEIFHSARWNHAADLTGKRVAVIGTGASAIQIVPELAKVAGHLDVYQRTAPWIMPRRDRPYTRGERWAFHHVPGFQKLSRELIYWGRESFVLGFAHNPRVLAGAQRIARKHLESQISDPELRAKVTPNFQMGCKRVLISNDYYPALSRETTELVTDRIAEVRPDAIVTADGSVREVDVIVVATGFHVTDSPTFDLIKGADGRTLGETWRAESMQAYKGSTIAGFPNMLMLVGPNTGLGHSSMVFMIESQCNYLLGALAAKRQFGLATFEVRREAQEAYNVALQRRLEHTIWKTGGCASWYLDQHGRNTTLWPKFTFQFRQETRHFDLPAYTTTALGEQS